MAASDSGSNVPAWASTAQYVNLVTLKRDGAKVSTAVWFALDNDRLYIYSNLDAGKMKRVRNNGQVEVGPCDVKGKPTGATVAARAVELPESKGSYVHALLTGKYGWKKRLVGLASAVPALLNIRRKKPDGYLEVTFT